MKSCTPLDNQEEYVYLIIRERDLPDVRVHVTDAYQYSRAWYLARPKEVRKRNSFIVCGYFGPGPAGGGYVDEAKAAGIGIGTVGKLMGALNYRDVWEYQTPEERATSQLRWSSSSPRLDSD